MTGSQKEWARYLGLDPKTARSTWSELKLEAPTDYVRRILREWPDEYYRQLQRHASIKKLALHWGVSESFLKKEATPIEEFKREREEWNVSVDTCLELFTRYRSVRFVARMALTTEAKVRRRVEALGLELTSLIDYSEGMNSNAKGRRAELDYARIRGVNILQDCNKELGSQHEIDFVDVDFRRVNVKAACRVKYKASTRKASPYFWKFSGNGRASCDHFALMFYTEKMETLLGWSILKSQDVPRDSSFHLLSDAIQHHAVQTS